MRSATVHQPNQPIDFPRLCWNTRWWRVRGAQAAVQPRGPRSVLFERGNSVLLRHGSENPSCSESQDLRGLERCTMCSRCRPFLKSVESDQTEMCVHCTCDWVKLFVLCPNGNFTDERSKLVLHLVFSPPPLPIPVISALLKSFKSHSTNPPSSNVHPPEGPTEVSTMVIDCSTQYPTQGGT